MKEKRVAAMEEEIREVAVVEWRGTRQDRGG
jgi:hypothetical protein